MIQFVQWLDRVSFPEAFKRLGDHQLDSSISISDQIPSSLTADRTINNPAKRVKLLTRVENFYQKCFVNLPEGMKYLVKQRRIPNVTHFKNYRIGFADSSLLEALPQDEDSLNCIGSAEISDFR